MASPLSVTIGMTCLKKHNFSGSWKTDKTVMKKRFLGSGVPHGRFKPFHKPVYQLTSSFT